MKLRYSLLTLAVAMGLTFGLSSCTEEDPIVPCVGIPTDVMVNTLNENQITAAWTRSADDVDADTLILIEADGTEHSAIAMGTSTTATVTGLSTGKVYTVKVASVGGRTAGFEWATAIRTQGITIYETSGSGAGQPSGLALTYGASQKAQALSINSADSLKIDLVLATDPTADAAFLSLQGANVVGSQIPTGKSAQLGDTVYLVNGGLDADFYSTGFASRITTKKYFDQFNSVGGSAIVLVKTMEGNYARVEVKEQADGKLFRMVSGVKAVDLIVSYQPLGGKAYASRPITRRGFAVPKLAGEGSVAVVKNAVK